MHISLYTHTHTHTYGASLVAQLVKNPPAMQETLVRFLGWEDPLEKGQVTHSSALAWRIPMDREAQQSTVPRVVGYSPWAHKDSDTNERLSTAHKICTHNTYTHTHAQWNTACIKKNEILSFTATWMDLITLSKVKEKQISHNITYMWNLKQ